MDTENTRINLLTVKGDELWQLGWHPPPQHHHQRVQHHHNTITGLVLQQYSPAHHSIALATTHTNVSMHQYIINNPHVIEASQVHFAMWI